MKRLGLWGLGTPHSLRDLLPPLLSPLKPLNAAHSLLYQQTSDPDSILLL